MITIWLNGILIHHKLEMDFNAKEVSVGIQDHINAIQFRNNWLERR
jgi:hypothetical protein